MKTTFLEFEQPIAELESKIEELRFVQDDSAVDISQEIGRLEEKKSNAREGHLFQLERVADRASGASPAASVHLGLR